MASIGRRFDATEHDTEKQVSGFNKPKEGVYKLEVIESSTTGTEEELRASFKVGIIEPEIYKDQWVYASAWITGPKSGWDSMGQPYLARLCRACGVKDIEDTDELHFKPFTAELRNGKPYQAKKDGIPSVDDNGHPVMRTNLEIKRFYYDDDEKTPVPAPHIFDVHPPANDNRPAPAARPIAANDNAPAPQPAAAAAGRSRPWKK